MERVLFRFVFFSFGSGFFFSWRIVYFLPCGYASSPLLLHRPMLHVARCSCSFLIELICIFHAGVAHWVCSDCWLCPSDLATFGNCLVAGSRDGTEIEVISFVFGHHHEAKTRVLGKKPRSSIISW